MSKKQVLSQDVRAGDVVFEHGYKWIVVANKFDPVGNTGNQPRHVLRCKPAEGTQVPGGYEDMTLGYLVNALVTIETSEDKAIAA